MGEFPEETISYFLPNVKKTGKETWKKSAKKLLFSKKIPKMSERYYLICCKS
jgi:hypothetical protein